MVVSDENGRSARDKGEINEEVVGEEMKSLGGGSPERRAADYPTGGFAGEKRRVRGRLVTIAKGRGHYW